MKSFLLNARVDGIFDTHPIFGQVKPGKYGNVFKLTPEGIYTSLHDFSGGREGANPIGNVI